MAVGKTTLEMVIYPIAKSMEYEFEDGCLYSGDTLENQLMGFRENASNAVSPAVGDEFGRLRVKQRRLIRHKS